MSFAIFLAVNLLARCVEHQKEDPVDWNQSWARQAVVAVRQNAPISHVKHKENSCLLRNRLHVRKQWWQVMPQDLICFGLLQVEDKWLLQFGG